MRTRCSCELRRRLRIGLFVLLLITGAACSGEVAEPDPAGTPDEEAPDDVSLLLADGTAPTALPTWMDEGTELQTVGARLLEENDAIVQSCVDRWPPDAEEPGRFVTAHLTPLGATVTFETELAWFDENGEPERTAAACDGVWDGSGFGWQVAHVPWPDAGLTAVGGGLSLQHKREDGSQTAFLWVTVPDGTAWVVHDDSAFRVAYPVAEGDSVRVTVTPGAEARDHLSLSVTFLRADGEVIDEREVEGAVAG